MKLRKCSSDALNGVFNNDQLRALETKSMAFYKWSNKTVESALNLKFSCGSKGYEALLKMNLPYPSVRTLQRRLQNLKFSSGILHEVLNFLKIKVNLFSSEHEKECFLLLDEMAITESIDYDVSSNSYMGDATFPNCYGQATHALVFLVGGISTRWKEVVAYYFTNHQAQGATLKDVVIKLILELEAIGLRINSITSDMGSVNQAMWKCFGIICGRKARRCHIEHPADPSRTIEFIADVPHLLKNIRSSILNNMCFIIDKSTQEKYQLSSPYVSSQHLNELVNYQEDMELKICHKLTKDHLNDSHFDKMKVSRATTVLSHDVSAGLKFMADEFKNESFATTSWFIEMVNKWFKLMTSRHPVSALSFLKLENYEEAISFLKEVIYIFRNLMVVGKNEKIVWKPVQTGVILSTTSVLRLQEKLLQEKKFGFLLTSRFSQDSLENLFSQIRSKQVIPTALQFKNNLKIISVAQYLKPCSTSSYTVDDSEFLSGFLNELKPVAKKAVQIKLPLKWDKNCNVALSNAKQNCLYHISGYIVSRVVKYSKVCLLCKAALISDTFDVTDRPYSKLVNLREFKENCLVHVKHDVFLFFQKLENIFCALENHFLQLENCKDFVIGKLLSNKDVESFHFPD